MATTRKIARELDSLGWSTTVPGEGDTWRATACPPRAKSGAVDGRSQRTVARMQASGLLGAATKDDEGSVCYPILGTVERAIVSDDSRAEYDAPA